MPRSCYRETAMSEKEDTATTPPGGLVLLDPKQLEQLALEGLRLRRELEERIAPMKTITATDLQLRSR
jgi:hypothetical protein